MDSELNDAETPETNGHVTFKAGGETQDLVRIESPTEEAGTSGSSTPRSFAFQYPARSRQASS